MEYKQWHKLMPESIIYNIYPTYIPQKGIVSKQVLNLTMSIEVDSPLTSTNLLDVNMFPCDPSWCMQYTQYVGVNWFTSQSFQDNRSDTMDNYSER